MVCKIRGRLGMEPIHTRMPSTTANDGVSLSSSVMELVDNFGLEANIVGIKSDGGGNIWVCREALESKYTNEYVFFHPSPYSPWSSLHIYWQGIVRQECNQSSRIMVRLTRN